MAVMSDQSYSSDPGGGPPTRNIPRPHQNAQSSTSRVPIPEPPVEGPSTARHGSPSPSGAEASGSGAPISGSLCPPARSENARGKARAAPIEPESSMSSLATPPETPPRDPPPSPRSWVQPSPAEIISALERAGTIPTQPEGPQTPVGIPTPVCVEPGPPAYTSAPARVPTPPTGTPTRVPTPPTRVPTPPTRVPTPPTGAPTRVPTPPTRVPTPPARVPTPPTRVPTPPTRVPTPPPTGAAPRVPTPPTRVPTPPTRVPTPPTRVPTPPTRAPTPPTFANSFSAPTPVVAAPILRERLVSPPPRSLSLSPVAASRDSSTLTDSVLPDDDSLPVPVVRRVRFDLPSSGTNSPAPVPSPTFVPPQWDSLPYEDPSSARNFRRVIPPVVPDHFVRSQRHRSWPQGVPSGAWPPYSSIPPVTHNDYTRSNRHSWPECLNSRRYRSPPGDVVHYLLQGDSFLLWDIRVEPKDALISGRHARPPPATGTVSDEMAIVRGIVQMSIDLGNVRLDKLQKAWGPIVIRSTPREGIALKDVMRAVYCHFHKRLTEEELFHIDSDPQSKTMLREQYRERYHRTRLSHVDQYRRSDLLGSLNKFRTLQLVSIYGDECHATLHLRS